MSRPIIKLGKYTISQESPCFVIAEVGHNHQGDLELAKKMLKAAAENGAHAVKLQKRTNNELFTKEAYAKPYDNPESFGATYGEHREALEFGEKEFLELKKLAEELGVVFMVTPFDLTAVDFLEKIGVPAYKIASACITDIPLLEHIAKQGKPIFLSTGTSTMEDVDRAYNAIKKYNVPLCLLQCTAAYPLEDYKQVNLNVIKTYMDKYPDIIVGYSGHESGIVLPVAAYMLGCRVVEKHFTLNRAMKGTDQKFSLEPQGLRKMTRDLKRVYDAVGSSEKNPQEVEAGPKKKLGKSVVVKTRIAKDSIVKPEMLTFKSPGTGIPPYKANEVLGRKALKDLEPDTLLDWSDLSEESFEKFDSVDWGALNAKK